MSLTLYQTQYFAHELTRRRASDDVEKLTASLHDASVDLNPHQVEAALFAFQSPLSKGAILADEVGLGKTIEAGILLSQFRATGKSRLLIICPASLRKQWSQELQEKFHLTSIILEASNFNEGFRAGKLNPFEQSGIVICSYQFAGKRAGYIQSLPWDLVVVDEAHRLRNVYRPSSRMGKTIKDAIYPFKKVLLTATPLQNSLMELYGLVSIVDEQVFGSVEAFRSRFARADDAVDYAELKDRIAPVITRTLRRHVQEYIRYTKRIPLTIAFEPTEEEQILYNQVSEYLQRQLLYALPANQRHLLTLIVRKLLASSTYAITATLDTLVNRLESLLEKAPQYDMQSRLWQDLEHLDELLDEWDTEVKDNQGKLTLEEVQQVKAELDELQRYRDMAMAITHNAKGEKLMLALDQGFAQLRSLGAAEKAIIFTESCRTQQYLFSLMQQTPLQGNVILFNGSNNDELSIKIYHSWLAQHAGTGKITGSPTADKRQALVDYFRDEAQIMIATEAAAEGINLQFCSMVINYDLPWNPQRIEQRIGRCHRYGQKHDVVVVNFLNTANAADQRVFELLDQKLHLFSGVFGASDDVLGALETGVDFERVIADIYQSCRTTEEINAAFDKLQAEMDASIRHRLRSAQEALLEHFDAAVISKLKTRLHESRVLLTRFEKWLWQITQLYLQPYAVFDSSQLLFNLQRNPFSFALPKGNYTLDKSRSDAYPYRAGHPLAKAILQHYRGLPLPLKGVRFCLPAGHKAAMLQPLAGRKGWLQLLLVSVESFEPTEHLLFVATTEDGDDLSQEQCQQLMELPAVETDLAGIRENNCGLQGKRSAHVMALAAHLKARDASYLQQEATKLNRWAEDRVYLLEKSLKDTKATIRDLTRQAGSTSDPETQLSIQKKLKDMERRQRLQRQEIFDAEDQIAAQRDSMIDEIEKRMEQKISEKIIFTIRWQL